MLIAATQAAAQGGAIETDLDGNASALVASS
jgi:hypothetical protein